MSPTRYASERTSWSLWLRRSSPRSRRRPTEHRAQSSRPTTRAVVRHLPAVAALLLSDDTSAPVVVDASRLAPIVVLRGAFRGVRLLEVVATPIGESSRAD